MGTPIIAYNYCVFGHLENTMGSINSESLIKPYVFDTFASGQRDVPKRYRFPGAFSSEWANYGNVWFSRWKSLESLESLGDEIA